jgi:hypothetical protein
LERIVDQIMNVSSTERSPHQRKGEKKTILRKIKTSKRLFTVKPLSKKVLFLKNKCVMVSSISEKIRRDNILRVIFLRNIIPFIRLLN